MYHQNYTTYLQRELDFLKLLVTRFHEQEQIASLELDVALQKTQGIYEQLLKMKLIHGSELEKTKAVPQKNERIVVPIKGTTTMVAEPQLVEFPEKIKQSETNVTPAIPPAKATEPVEPKKGTVVVQKRTAVREEPLNVVQKEKGNPEESNTSFSKVKTAILAEKIRPSSYQPINETLAQQKAGSDLSTRWQTTPLDSIASGIGLNDKFLYIRELFLGDNTLYNDTIRQLDAADSLDDALDFMFRHFIWDKENGTVQKFINLVYRRYGK